MKLILILINQTNKKWRKIENMKGNQRRLPRRKESVLKLWEFRNTYLETFDKTTTFGYIYSIDIYIYIYMD